MATSYDGQRFRLMYELGYAFASRTGIDELIPFVIAKCRGVLDAEGVSVLVLDEDHNELYFPYISEEDPEVRSRLARLRFSAESGLAGSALRTGRAEKIDDVTKGPRFYAEIDRLTGFRTRSLMAAPMASGGTPVGVTEVVNRRSGGVFTDDDLALLEEIRRNLYAPAKAAMEAGRREFSDYQRLRAQMEGDGSGGLADIYWCGSAACETKIREETKATCRAIPLGQKNPPGKCIVCGEPASERAFFVLSLASSACAATSTAPKSPKRGSLAASAQKTALARLAGVDVNLTAKQIRGIG